MEPSVPAREDTVTERLLLVISMTEVQSKFGRRISMARPTLDTKNTMQSGRMTFLKAVSMVMWPFKLRRKHYLPTHGFSKSSFSPRRIAAMTCLMWFRDDLRLHDN